MIMIKHLKTKIHQKEALVRINERASFSSNSNWN